MNPFWNHSNYVNNNQFVTQFPDWVSLSAVTIILGYGFVYCIYTFYQMCKKYIKK